MSEFNWLTCDDPAEMLRRVIDSASKRKLDLFVYICRAEDQIDGDDLQSIDESKRFATDWATKGTPRELLGRADILREIFPPPHSKRCPECNSEVIPIQRSFYPVPLSYCVKCDFSGPPWPDWIKYPFPAEWRTPHVIGIAQRIDGIESESCDQCFGHGWYDWYPDDDPTNSRLEGGIETKCSKCDGEGRIEKQGEPDFSAMPILADALEEAGCEDEAILNHCRSGGPHLRGCWVIDLILGRE